MSLVFWEVDSEGVSTEATFDRQGVAIIRQKDEKIAKKLLGLVGKSYDSINGNEKRLLFRCELTEDEGDIINDYIDEH